MSKHKVFRDSDDDLDSDNELEEELDDGSEEEGSLQLLQESDSDSDGAPEDVGFSQSKESALRKVTEALNSIKQQNLKIKEKRKKKEEVFKQQKKQKLDTLAKSRLPDDFLKDVKSAPVVAPVEPSNDQNDVPAKEEDNTEFYDDFGEDYDTEDIETTQEEDFIPLGSSQIKAVFIEDHIKTSQSSAEKAATFMKDRLYGKGIPRESTKSMQNRQVKRKARFAPTK